MILNPGSVGVVVLLGAAFIAASGDRRQCRAALEPEAAVQTSPVEQVTQKPRRITSALGTVRYAPSDREKPYFEKLAPNEIATGGLAGEYDITAKDGKYVGWFGIVREVQEDEAARKTVLTVEHKYFDGLTDAHILALSFNGSGDFSVVLPGVGHRIEPLTLIKAYGKVSNRAPGDQPELSAEFVRNWHWGTFTFLLAKGTQRGSEKWRKLNQVDLDEIYDPYPDDTYYERRLGQRPGAQERAAEFRRSLLEAAGKTPPEIAAALVPLAEAIAAKDADAADQAARALAEAGAQRPAAALVLAAFRSEDEEVRRTATGALYWVARGAVDLLAEALADGHPRVRLGAARGLAFIGSNARPAIGALIRTLGDDEADVRAEAADALGAIGPGAESAASRLGVLLKDQHPQVRHSAAQALWYITFDSAAVVPVLVEALQNSDADVRRSVAELLGNIGPDATAAIPHLVQALQDEDEYVRMHTAEALGAIGADERAAPALIATTRDEGEYVRRRAVAALGQLPKPSEAVMAAVIKALGDEDSHVRFEAASALQQLGPSGAAALPALIDRLENDDDEDVRWNVAGALGAIDAGGQSAVGPLRKALQGQGPTVRRFAARGLGRIGPAARQSLAELREALRDEDPGVRVEAAAALWKITGEVDASMPVLIESLQHRDWRVRMWAANSIEGIGPQAGAAVPQLIENLRHEIRHVRTSAASALGRLDEAARPAAPALASLLADETPEIRAHAAGALWHITRDARAIPTLIGVLEGSERGHWVAADALAGIGPDAREAVPALRRAQKQRDPHVRRAVAEALRKVDAMVQE